MSKAPEWIYLDGDVEAGDGMFPRCFENPKYASEPQVEYVRVDLAEAAEQQGYASAMEDARKLHEARIEELEAKLAIAWDTQTVKILIKTAYKEGWADGGDNVPLGSGWEKSRTKATIAELTGGKDD